MPIRADLRIALQNYNSASGHLSVGFITKRLATSSVAPRYSIGIAIARLCPSVSHIASYYRYSADGEPASGRDHDIPAQSKAWFSSKCTMRIVVAGGGGFASLLVHELSQTPHAILVLSQSVKL